MMDQKKLVNYKNDLAFRCIFGENSEDSEYLRKITVEGVFGIKCKSLTTLNPDLNPQNIQDKDMILDIKGEDEKGNIMNFEMQNSSFLNSDRIRFQCYGCDLVTRQIHPGQNYLTVKSVNQIIFIAGLDKDRYKLVDLYKSRNEKGQIEKLSLIARAFVQIPYIDIIREHKELEEFSEFELMNYIFQNEFDDDIMYLYKRRKVVRIMKDKIDHFNNDDDLRELAFKRELSRITQLSRELEQKETGIAEGFKKGHEQGLVEGLAKGQEQGLSEGEVKTITDMVTSYVENRFHENIADELNDLSLSSLQQIKDEIFTLNTIEEIRELINRV